MLVTTSLLLEIGVRWWGYSEHYICDPICRPLDTVKDIPYVYKSNLVNKRAHGRTIINTDSLGLRSVVAGAQYAHKNEGEYRIAVLGDSVTFGEGVRRTEDTFCQRIEAILNQRQGDVSVRVFNFGVSSYGIQEMLATLTHRVLAIDPDLILLAVIIDDFNPLRANIVDRWGYRTSARQSGLIPMDFIAKPILRKVHLTYFLRDIYYRMVRRDQNEQINISKDKLSQSYKYVIQFKKFAEEKKLPYKLILLPWLSDRNYQIKGLLERLIQDEITVIDLSRLINKFSPEQFFASRFDKHPSADVHKEIGRLLSGYILQEYLKRL